MDGGAAEERVCSTSAHLVSRTPAGAVAVVLACCYGTLLLEWGLLHASAWLLVMQSAPAAGITTPCLLLHTSFMTLPSGCNSSHTAACI